MQEAVERQHRVDFAEPHFLAPAYFDAGLGEGAGAAGVTRHEDDVAHGLQHTCRDCAGRRVDELRRDARLD